MPLIDGIVGDSTGRLWMTIRGYGEYTLQVDPVCGRKEREWFQRETRNVPRSKSLTSGFHKLVRDCGGAHSYPPELTNFDDNEGYIIAEGALTPRSDAVKNCPPHLG
jgi:hypothetical protein